MFIEYNFFILLLMCNQPNQNKQTNKQTMSDTSPETHVQLITDNDTYDEFGNYIGPECESYEDEEEETEEEKLQPLSVRLSKKKEKIEAKLKQLKTKLRHLTMKRSRA